MDVAQEVERTPEVPGVVPGTLADDLDLVHLVGAPQHVDAAEALLAETSQGPPEVAVLTRDDVAAEVAVGSSVAVVSGCVTARFQDLTGDSLSGDRSSPVA